MGEEAIIRQNLIDDKIYRPYCIKFIIFCHNRRAKLRLNGQFMNPNYKRISKFPNTFTDKYINI